MKIRTTDEVRLDVSLSKEEAGVLAIMIYSLDWVRLERAGYGTNLNWCALTQLLEDAGDPGLAGVTYADFSEYHR